tara:strand:- start:840 stop:1355 length:516 start_codon:yes stop_codon:yes gene_type:complete
MTPHPHHSIPPQLPPANCFTVLVIDDLPQNRVLLRKFLKTAGYAVIEATNGIEALDILRRKHVRPDLIVTDIEMPVMDGITLVEQIRYLDDTIATIPIIAASGNADEEMRHRALRAGSDQFMTKPFDLGELRREMATLLKLRRQSVPIRNSKLSPPATNRLDPNLEGQNQG